MSLVYLSRKVHISAAHRMHSCQLSDEENKRVYGPCNNLHGHNYTIKVTVCGPVDPVTGMVVDMEIVKAAIDRSVTQPLDHRNIDADVGWFKNTPSTVENITRFIWRGMKESLGELAPLLYEVKVNETNKNSCFVRA